MSMTYIIVAFATVLLNNVFLSFAPFEIRIAFGYIISFSTLIFVAICEVAWHLFETTTAYTVNLTAISLVAMGCTGECNLCDINFNFYYNVVYEFFFCFISLFPFS